MQLHIVEPTTGETATTDLASYADDIARLMMVRIVEEADQTCVISDETLDHIVRECSLVQNLTKQEMTAKFFVEK